LGAGKSVLSSIIAYNIHGKAQIVDGVAVVPYAVYFSYSQPAQGLYHYIDEILFARSDGVTRDVPYPLILSPKPTEGSPRQFGLADLQSNLIGHLENLPPGGSPFGVSDQEWSFRRTLLEEYPAHIQGSTFWDTAGSQTWNSIPRPVIPPGMKRIDVRPFVFIDAVNFFFDWNEARQAVAALIGVFRSKKWPLVLTIENSGENAKSEHRQLMSSVEFEADTVVELAVRATEYTRHTIEVKKNRHSQPIYGPQLYRIEKPEHSLSNIPRHGQPHTGFMIFHSIHWFLSHARERHLCTSRYHSGMHEFDGILTKGVPTQAVDPEQESLLPPDSFILVRGHKGGHKLSIAFNLLVAGLWDNRKREPPDGDGAGAVTSESRNVLLLSLGEEINLTIPKIALARSLDLAPHAHNNGDRFEFRIDGMEPVPEHLANPGKIMLRGWRPAGTPATGQLIEATFKAGYLSPDEFLWVVEHLVMYYNPCRILIENTAHLRMRFPELHHERMLFAAISSLTQSKQIMVIVTDVLGEGSDVQLSYGLAASADCVVDLSPLTREDFYVHKHYEACAAHLKAVTRGKTDSIPTWSKMAISNVRGKNYRRAQYGITVFNMKQRNSLFLLDISHFFDPDEQAPL
jgi:hypothetical protein